MNDGWTTCPQCEGLYTSYPKFTRAMCGLCVNGKVPTRIAPLLSKGKWIHRPSDHWYWWCDGDVSLHVHISTNDIVISGDCDEDQLPAFIKRLQEVQDTLERTQNDGLG